VPYSEERVIVATWIPNSEQIVCLCAVITVIAIAQRTSLILAEYSPSVITRRLRYLYEYRSEWCVALVSWNVSPVSGLT
jgi:hypothetical protein